MRRPTSTLLTLVLAGGVIPLGATTLTGPATAADRGKPRPSVVGRFGAPFEQPQGINCLKAKTEAPECKPAAMAMAALPNESVLYYDGLEGMRNVDYNVVLEFSNVAENDQSRVMDLVGRRTPRWSTPRPEDGGANPGGNDDDAEYLPGVPHNNDNLANDGDLFCSDLVFLADGRVLVTGGTNYYLEPGVSGVPYGVTELEGLPNSRIFDQRTKKWTQSGSMHHGRWYPSMVTLGSGKVFVASGVTKLIKPVYPDRPLESGTNVKQTEVYNPRTGKWSENPDRADRSLPLYPRLHLLPNGHVYYDAAGQTFNPAGQSYDEALWNIAASFDPKSKTWKDLGIPTIGGAPLGFRGSGFSVMMPLVPNRSGDYTKATFLSGGGVVGVSPGTYLATDTATLNTVDTTRGDALTSRPTGKLNRPRWYGTGTVLPTGEVYLANGASADEVVLPGSAKPITTAEIYNPKTGQWRDAARQSHGRTYHNTAMLLPDGRVLLGGHAPIATGYAFQTDAGHEAIGLSKSGHDPSFEIYSPPYLFRGTRPRITRAPAKVRNDSRVTITVKSPSRVKSVRLVRNTSLTHLIDGDQRSVVLDVVKRRGKRITVRVPDSDVLPAGPYMLFANRGSKKGEIPSKATQTFVR